MEKNFKKRAFVNVEEFAKDIMDVLDTAALNVGVDNIMEESDIITVIGESDTAEEISSELWALYEAMPEMFEDDVVGYG